jgi:hypothetical protein
LIAQRKASSPRILNVRPLVEADLEALRQPSAGARLQNIRDSHHKICRLMASGLKLWEVAQRTGFSVARLSVLSKDPSIIELVAHYRNLITEDWRDEMDSIIEDDLATARMTSRMIRDKVEAADAGEEEIPLKTLLALGADAKDRHGYGKKTHQTNVNIDFAANLEAAIARSKKVISS